MPVDDYEGVFELPPPEDQRCSNPKEAKQYPYSHKDLGGCPYHAKHSERIEVIPPKVAPAWDEWNMYRELFANATYDNTDLEYIDEVREFYLSQMLKQVTETNPPYAPDTYNVYIRKQFPSDFELLSSKQKVLMGALLAWIVLLFIGIILL